MFRLAEMETYLTLPFPSGTGEKLGDIPRTSYQIAKMKPADLKPLHAILFDRPGKVGYTYGPSYSVWTTRLVLFAASVGRIMIVKVTPLKSSVVL